MWNSFLEFLNKNQDALNFLIGPGVALVILGGLFKFIKWLIKELRNRQIRSNDNFPFKRIFPGSNVAKEILGGEDNNPLADRNIPYQQRVAGRNIRREIEDALNKNRWVLITGKTGLGKTREAVNVAESLSKEGWTILFLTHGKFLSAPPELPEDLPERKLLFFLDALNLKMYASRAEQNPKAEDHPLQPLTIPLQERIFETLKTFEIFCGRAEILVLATARDEKFSDSANEPSEWDKLGFKKFNEFWRRFTLYPLSEPEDHAEINLIKDTVHVAEIKADATEFPAIAKINDGTFLNLVENIRTAHNQNEDFQLSKFQHTLKGTWEKRYQDAITKHRFSKYIYDAVDLSRAVGLRLSFTNVLSIANIIAGKDSAKFCIISNRRLLRRLEQKENIFEPRDGQIEAKKYRIRVDKYLSQLYFQVRQQSYYDRRPHKWLRLWISSCVWFFYSLILRIIPRSVFIEEKISTFDRIFNLVLIPGIYLHQIALAYSGLSYTEHSIRLQIKANTLLEKWDWSHLVNRYVRPYGFSNLGWYYGYQKQTDEAIKNFKKAIEINPKFVSAWSGLAWVYGQNNRFEEAIQVCQRIIVFKPESAGPWSNLGWVYSQQDRLEEATQAYFKAIELDPKLAMAWNNLGWVYIDQGHSDEAMQAFQKAIELNQKFANPWYGLSRAFILKNDYSNAQFACRKAIEIAPKVGLYHCQLISILKRSYRSEEAAKEEEIARPLMEKESEYERSRFESICGSVEEAVRLLEIAIDEKEITIRNLKTNPDFDFIRDDPRFLALISEESID